jgi:hypothetical protein
MAWAIVDNGTVRNIVIYQTGEGFTNVPDRTTIGATWDGQQWVEPAPVVQPRIIFDTEFWDRFTPTERIEIHASADTFVHDLIRTLKIYRTLDLNDTKLVLGIGYLASLGLLTAERAAEVLA